MNTTYGRVGDRIFRTEELDELPIGTVMGETNGGGSQWRKQPNGRWANLAHGVEYRPNQFASGGMYTIVSLPEGWETIARPKESAAQFIWRYRDGALTQAEAHGIPHTTVEQALTKMGAGKDSFPLGPGVTLRNNPDMQDLPDGSVVYRGRPETLSGFGVYAKKNGRWIHLLGEQPHQNGVPITVDSINGDRTPVAWVTTEATDADDEAIKRFKARAWQVGYKLKRAQGWCSTYEAIVNQLGVTQEDLNNVTFEGVRVGDEVDPEEARTLPRGSLFRWQHREYNDRFAVYMRVRNTDNRAGTRRVYGQTAEGLRLGHFKDRMTVLHIEQGEGLNYQLVNSGPEFRVLPPGTEFMYNDNAMVYRIARDGKITDRQVRNGDIPMEGNWAVADFGTNPRIVVTGFPIDPNEEH